MYKIYDNIHNRYGKYEYATESMAQMVVDELIAEHEAIGNPVYEYFIHDMDYIHWTQPEKKPYSMNIKILYTLHTDGDYGLRDMQEFGAEEDDEYDYVGEVTFTDKNSTMHTSKLEAIEFLKRFLCEGIYIGTSHMWLMKDFYDIIENLINFINDNDSGIYTRSLSGNHEGTEFIVVIKKE